MFQESTAGFVYVRFTVIGNVGVSEAAGGWAWCGWCGWGLEPGWGPLSFGAGIRKDVTETRTKNAGIQGQIWAYRAQI